MPLGFDGFVALDRISGDRSNLAILDADIEDFVQHGFRIDHSTAQNDEIVVLSVDRTAANEK